MFDGKVYLSHKEDQILTQLKVPVKSKPAKPAPKRAGRLHSPHPPHLPILSQPRSLNMSKSSRFGLVKGNFTQCLWKGHPHRRNINAPMALTLPALCMHCCGYKVLQLCGAIPPPHVGNRHIMTAPPPPPPWGRTVTTLEGVPGHFLFRHHVPVFSRWTAWWPPLGLRLAKCCASHTLTWGQTSNVSGWHWRSAWCGQSSEDFKGGYLLLIIIHHHDSLLRHTQARHRGG